MRLCDGCKQGKSTIGEYQTNFWRADSVLSEIAKSAVRKLDLCETCARVLDGRLKDTISRFVSEHEIHVTPKVEIAREAVA